MGSRYAAALFWTPIHPDYRAALTRGVLAAKSPTPRDFRAAFLAVDDAIALKPVDPDYHLLKARLAKRALLAGPGEHDWVVMAEEEYARAQVLDPLRPNALLERGWMRVSIHDLAGGLSDADAALRSEPNLFEARRLRAVALLALHRSDEARAEIAEARRRHESLSGYAPTTRYEAQILTWQAEAWDALVKQTSAS